MHKCAYVKVFWTSTLRTVVLIYPPHHTRPRHLSAVATSCVWHHLLRPQIATAKTIGAILRVIFSKAQRMVDNYCRASKDDTSQWTMKNNRCCDTIRLFLAPSSLLRDHKVL